MKSQRTQDSALDRAFPNAVTGSPLTPLCILSTSTKILLGALNYSQICFSHGKKEKKKNIHPNIHLPVGHNLRDI
jgi:hypothetical protein